MLDVTATTTTTITSAITIDTTTTTLTAAMAGNGRLAYGPRPYDMRRRTLRSYRDQAPAQDTDVSVSDSDLMSVREIARLLSPHSRPL
jgi:hypothetical protein